MNRRSPATMILGHLRFVARSIHLYYYVQVQFYPSTLSNIYQPSLLVADWDDNDYISLYTADISPSFLDRFDYPASRPVLSCTMTIKRAKIQYRPYETFPARVLAVVSGYAGRPMGLRENDITAQEKLENGLGSKGKEKH